MSAGRTMWRAKDVGWWAREWIVTLGEEFGADGPAVIDWLEDQAKLQNDGGRVKTGPRAVSRGCFVDVVTVGHVVSRAVTLGLLSDYSENQGRFECTIVWFRADQGKASAAARKADQRARESTDTGDLAPVVTLGHGESRPVTKSHLTVQDNTNTSSRRDEKAAKEREKATQDDRDLCRLLADQVLAHNPKRKIQSDIEWLRSMRLLREQDGNAPAEIEAVIRWLFADPGKDATFWADTIQSAHGLREHFATVWGKMHANGAANGSATPVESSAAYAARRGLS